MPWRLDASQSGGGLIMDVGCHVIDRIDYLCGPMENVKGFAEIGESDWAAANKNCKVITKEIKNQFYSIFCKTRSLSRTNQRPSVVPLQFQ